MPATPTAVRALGLCSGGLDSILAALVLQQQKIAVEWLTFVTPFFSASKAQQAAKLTGIPLKVVNITPEYMQMLRDPPCGYGKYMNPCMDCHALMFRLAGEEMTSAGFAFLFSGEVLGQRPMSQTQSSLRYVEKHSGMQGYILRPLSAQRLPETIAESKGLVDRSRLLDLSGRSRKPQLQMAKAFGITKFPTPAGGCLLTDKKYSIRLRDLLDHQKEVSERELHLLKYGRQFRTRNGLKFIIGRNKQDNALIQCNYDPQTDVLIKLTHLSGPLGLIPQKATRAEILLVGSAVAGYAKAAPHQAAEIRVNTPDGSENLDVLAIAPTDIRNLMI
jgi:tRNA U34 2-thiouridine synthase MnmA/TrmU